MDRVLDRVRVRVRVRVMDRDRLGLGLGLRLGFTKKSTFSRWKYIIKLENLQQELAFAYKQINGIDLPIKFPTPGDKYSDEKKLEQLRQVPFFLVKEVLTTIYKTDYQLFGYEMPDKPF